MMVLVHCMMARNSLERVLSMMELCSWMLELNMKVLSSLKLVHYKLVLSMMASHKKLTDMELELRLECS